GPADTRNPAAGPAVTVDPATGPAVTGNELLSWENRLKADIDSSRAVKVKIIRRFILKFFLFDHFWPVWSSNV
ncbi:MAG: hypothetical protein MUE37_14850, partial [Bacteroidales bacterium]|nr:hypothetical protein [Bacteroidales bacterium]